MVKIPSLNVNSKGESYFSEVDSAHASGNAPREQAVAHWQIWQTQPGFFQDFKPSAEPRWLAILSGKLEITSSLGERRFFSRGDAVLLQDMGGAGHAIRTYGWEPCNVIRITLKEIMTATVG